MPVSITSIVRRLFVAVVICASLAALFRLVGLPVIAVPFFLATTIELGLIVVAVAWRAITRAHPDSN